MWLSVTKTITKARSRTTQQQQEQEHTSNSQPSSANYSRYRVTFAVNIIILLVKWTLFHTHALQFLVNTVSPKLQAYSYYLPSELTMS